MTSKYRRTLFKWSLLIGGIVLALTIGELLARIMSPHEREVPDGLIQRGATPGDLWSLKPGYQGRQMSSEFDVAVRVNSAGLRGPEPGDIRPRVLFLGDSFTFGWGVEEAETFLSVAANQVGRESGHPIEVLNGGVPGYGPGRALEKLRTTCATLKPDHVVFAFYSGNDLADLLQGHRLLHDEALRHELDELNSAWAPGSRADSFLIENSALYKTAYGLTWRACFDAGHCSFKEDPFHAYQIPANVRPRASVALGRVLGMMQQAASDCGASLSIVMLPAVSAVEYPDRSNARVEELKAIDASVAEWAAVHGVPSTDLTQDMVQVYAKNPHEPLFFKYDLHFTRAGHAVAGASVARFLLQSVLPRTAKPSAADQKPVAISGLADDDDD